MNSQCSGRHCDGAIYGVRISQVEKWESGVLGREVVYIAQWTLGVFWHILNPEACV